jgi:hypothetical protein
MDSAGDTVSIARGISEDDSYRISTAVDLPEDTSHHISELTQDVGTPCATLARQQPGTTGAPHVSYGLADILFPVKPPKPKGARLIRGPLRFN